MMRLGCFLEPGGGLRRIEDGFRKGTLTCDRETDDFGLLDRALCGFLCRRDDEIADAAPLNLGGAFDDRQRVGRYARLDTCRANGFLGHHTTSHTTRPRARPLMCWHGWMRQRSHRIGARVSPCRASSLCSDS